MGRKKIEIRPLTDERNRNVTFLKRKAGLMKKAWELSVLCGADVNILIFNVAGKAYEFSSKELDEEIDRYMDYEGMIERRRAPEFAAMALAGEDEEDEDDEEPSNRRASTSKAGTNSANAVNANGAAPRSLKGKESFKARTPRHGSGDKGKHSKSKSKTRRRKERSESEKRSFIDSILSDSESSDPSDETDSRRRRKEKERRERRKEEERYHHHDKNSEALQYAMNMHSSHSHGQPHQDPRYAQHLHAGRERYYEVDGSGRHPNSLPLDIPQLPKLPSDGAPYRASMTSGLGNNPQTQVYYGTSSTPLPSNQYISNSNVGQYSVPPPNLSSESPFPPQSYVSSSSGINQQNNYGNIQWNEQLIAKYAEFQLQQNHQRQQRLLLERQRHQLQQMGVPVDERSLLDEIFGGGGGGSNGNQNNQTPGNSNESYHNNSSTVTSSSMILPLELDEVQSSSNNSINQQSTTTGQQNDFIWPIGPGPGPGHGHGSNSTTTTPNPIEDSQGQVQGQEQFTGIGLSRQQNTRSALPNEGIAWGVQDGYNIDREEINLPSPISNGSGIVSGYEISKRKLRREDSDLSLKRVRM
ncbi:uncharacterized protein I206_103155 [Kwoniella pini CBS 10737]|uniref:MADS-box domain-containing protein n=1 Tax=Kwoniella pini CBS 10737 TaxID=1296096 RepID=A0A1B9IAG9_9TREE|nr:uncharacterized protein I206_01840 [Kwoniella pini CBS 10737]OCF52549.1 hypothetical protein I206_01840 [Kwoniella pini CBS 10737]